MQNVFLAKKQHQVFKEIGAPNVFIWLASVKENWKGKAFARSLSVVCGKRGLDESHN